MEFPVVFVVIAKNVKNALKNFFSEVSYYRWNSKIWKFPIKRNREKSEVISYHFWGKKCGPY